jgi:hypothetical protein
VQDAEGDLATQVAEDMQMSVGGARYYIRLASVPAAKEKCVQVNRRIQSRGRPRQPECHGHISLLLNRSVRRRL